MIEVQMKSLEKAERILRALGVQFAIVLQDGREFGNAKLEVPPVRKRGPRFDWGDRAFIQSLTDSKPGDVICVPLPKHAAVEMFKRFQSFVTAHAHRIVGPGNYTTMRNVGTRQLEILIVDRK